MIRGKYRKLFLFFLFKFYILLISKTQLKFQSSRSELLDKFKSVLFISFIPSSTLVASIKSIG